MKRIYYNKKVKISSTLLLLIEEKLSIGEMHHALSLFQDEIFVSSILILHSDSNASEKNKDV